MLKKIRVRDYMTESLVSLRPEMELLDAVHELVENRISGAPVVDQTGDIVGLLSEKDCLRLALVSGYHGGGHALVRDYMTAEVVTVHPETTILELAQRFLDLPFRRYPVVERNRLIGMISRRDVLRGLLKLR